MYNEKQKIIEQKELDIKKLNTDMNNLQVQKTECAKQTQENVYHCMISLKMLDAFTNGGSVLMKKNQANSDKSMDMDNINR
eukprot:UN07514